MDIENAKLTNKDERQRLIDLIEQHLARSDPIPLKKISNELLELGAVEKNKNIIYLSYVPYVLYKILTQPHLVHSKGWHTNKEALFNFLDFLETKELEEFPATIDQMKKYFKNKDHELYRYIKHMIHKAKVKQAAKLYSKGFSLNAACNFTDAPKHEVLSYLSTSKEHEFTKFDETLKEKVRILEKLFKGIA